MNYQKHDASINAEEAFKEILIHYPEAVDEILLYEMEYWAYPQTFSSTSGPFKKEGRATGQAFTKYTIEAWVEGKYAVLFTHGKIIKTINNWDGPGSVRL